LSKITNSQNRCSTSGHRVSHVLDRTS